jgi:trypsin-like peptidase
MAAMASPLEEFSADDLLFELRAREESERAADESLPDVAESDEDGPELNPQLESFDTQELSQALRDTQEVIYGVDDRVDIFAVTDAALLKDADCLVALFDAADVTDNGNGTSTLATSNFGTSRNLCAGEPFRDQPIGAFCSGFLVAPDLVATAGHCVDPPDTPAVENIRFVFGFRMVDAATGPPPIANGEIYSGAQVVGRELDQSGIDWALVRLDRAVTNHRPAPIRRRRRIGSTAGVHVIGHPVGLPAKVAAGASVRDNTPGPFFVANLDTYGGNSGSPVFNSRTHVIEGILVRGERDFVRSGNCSVSFVCPTTGCRGEDVTRITKLAGLIPPAA